MANLKFDEEGKAFLSLSVRASQGYEKTEISEILEDGTLKLKVKEVPEKGKANKEIQKFLKKTLGVKEVEIVNGSRDNRKLVRIRK